MLYSRFVNGDYEKLEFKHVSSHATGRVTFEDVASAEPFRIYATDLQFSFSIDASWPHQYPVTSWSISTLASMDSNWWSWNPVSSILDVNAGAYAYPHGSFTYIWFDTTTARFVVAQDSELWAEIEQGHWMLEPEPDDVVVLAGEGDDTVWAGAGDSLVFGDAGDDAIHGGSGARLLDGGEGRDTIWAGAGEQQLFGGRGDDELHAGPGRQTVEGGAGRDTIIGGSGANWLDGGAGRDFLTASSGNETLTGGGGRDVFAFGSDSGRDVIADFDLGQDVIQVARGINGSAVVRAEDVTTWIASDGHGNAVLSLGDGAGVTLLDVSARTLQTHVGELVRVM